MSSSLTHPTKRTAIQRTMSAALAMFLTAGSVLVSAAPAFAEEGDAQDAPPAAAQAGANNADIPEAGEYTCVKPGKHELLASLVSNTQARAVMLDYTGQGEPVQRENYSVVIPVPDYTMNTVSADDIRAGLGVIATEGTPVWTLPQAQTTSAPWIGISSAQWDFTKSNAAGLHFYVRTLIGPGQMKLWSYDQEAGIEVRVDSADDSVMLSVDKPGVTNLNTSFTVPGFYEVDYAFSSNLKGFRPTTVKALYLVYYAVGDDMVRRVCGEEFLHKPTTDSSAASNVDPNTGANGATTGQNSDNSSSTPTETTPPSSSSTTTNQGNDEGTSNSGEQTNSQATDPQTNGQGQHNPGSGSSPDETTEQGQGNTAMGEQTTPGTSQTDSEKKTDTSTEGSSDNGAGKSSDTLSAATDGAKNNKTTEDKKQQEQPILNLPAGEDTQKPSEDRRRRTRAPQEQPPVGDNGPEVCEAVVITRESEPEEADKVRRAQGEEGTARTVINVSVGDNARGNANDGHFDLGALIDNGTVYARVKDDRTQPAQWLDPADIVFALGKPAEISAPAALNFVAPTGKKVWMVQQSQQKNVPWIGMNSQHPSILQETTGTVTFTLESVDGPGKVAVFSSGSFGGGVGDIVFDGAGSSYTIGANTHAHHNWVFTEPGNYTLTLSMKVEGKNGAIKGSNGVGGNFIITGDLGPNGRPMIKETVGRTPSGKECDLNAGLGSGPGLAKTGASNILPMVISTLGVGIVMLAARKRRV